MTQIVALGGHILKFEGVSWHKAPQYNDSGTWNYVWAKG